MALLIDKSQKHIISSTLTFEEFVTFRTEAVDESVVNLIPVSIHTGSLSREISSGENRSDSNLSNETSVQIQVFNCHCHSTHSFHL